MNWKHTSILNFSVFFLYACTWHVGWFLSQNLETIIGLTSWFLPAGIRATALLLIPRKYWLSIFLSEVFCIYLVNLGDPRFGYWIGVVLATFPPIIIYMVCVNKYLLMEKKVRFNNMSSTIILMGYLILAALFTSLLLSFSLIIPQQITFNQILPTLLSYMMGDVVGVLLILPLSSIMLSLYNREIRVTAKKSLLILLIIIFAIYLAMFILINQPQGAYYLQLLAFIPIVFLAYEYGWTGASLGIVVVNILVVVTNMVISDSDAILSTQFYLIILSMTGLILGAATSQQQEIASSLNAKNIELYNVVEELSDQVNKNAKLARKIVSIQENERKMISRELHDDIGQSVTALKTHLFLVRKLYNKAIVVPTLDAIDEITDGIYSSVYNLMHLLRPRILDDLGLEAVLTGDNFRHVLNNAGIEFLSSVEGDVTKLDEELKLAIYRITQECINNAIKYSKAEHFFLKMQVTINHVNLHIQDDGVGVSQMDYKEGTGIQGIEDRVTALAGFYQLSTSKNGTEHHVRFEL